MKFVTLVKENKLEPVKKLCSAPIQAKLGSTPQTKTCLWGPRRWGTRRDVGQPEHNWVTGFWMQ